MSTTNNLNYIVQIGYGGNAVTLTGVTSISYIRALQPKNDSATITVSGALPFYSTTSGNPISVGPNTILSFSQVTNRELFIWRVDAYGNQMLVWRGVITHINRVIDVSGITTQIQAQGFWFVLSVRYLAIAGLTPYGVGGGPSIGSSNPYYMALNAAPNGGGVLDKTVTELLNEIFTVGYGDRDSNGTISTIEFGQAPQYNNVVIGDPLYIQYQSIASVLEQIIYSDLFTAECQIDFTQSSPLFNVFQFNPALGLYGVGVNKSSSAIFIEGQNIQHMEFDSDFEDMANRVIFYGSQFQGTQIAIAPVQNISSITAYGLQESAQSLGTIVASTEMTTYWNNILPFTMVPIPTISLTPVQWWSNSIWINPGDVITVQSPTIISVLGAVYGGISGNIATMRTHDITRKWDANNGEQTNLTLTYPVTTSNQQTSGMVSQSLGSSFETLQNNVTSQANLLQGAMSMQQTNGSYNLLDVVAGPNTSYYRGVGGQPVNIQYQNITYLLSVTFNITSPDATTAMVIITGPSGQTIYNSVVTVGVTVDITQIIQSLNLPTGGNFIFLILNTDSPNTHNYSLNVVTNAIGVGATTQTATGVNSAKTTGGYIYP